MGRMPVRTSLFTGQDGLIGTDQCAQCSGVISLGGVAQNEIATLGFVGADQATGGLHASPGQGIAPVRGNEGRPGFGPHQRLLTLDPARRHVVCFDGGAKLR
ncbi:hypothetical protein D3C80_1610280 [compost metagenome]